MLWPQPWPRPGQRVVLGEERDPRPVGPAPAGEPAADRGREAAGRVLHLEPRGADRVGDTLGGVVLLEGGLGVGVDARATAR